MSALATQQREWTEDEYLAFERSSDEKHDFIDGQVMDMAGATRRHVRLQQRLSKLLETALERHGSCESYGSDMKVRVLISTKGRPGERYPDASIACNPTFLDANEDVLTNPCVIFEILSKSTEAEDRGDKFRDYRSVPSFQEYVLIQQKTVLAEHYTRQPNGTWNLAILPGSETLRLACAPVEILVKDLYLGLPRLMEGDEQQ